MNKQIEVFEHFVIQQMAFINVFKHPFFAVPFLADNWQLAFLHSSSFTAGCAWELNVYGVQLLMTYLPVVADPANAVSSASCLGVV